MTHKTLEPELCRRYYDVQYLCIQFVYNKMKKIANVSVYNNMEEICIMDDQDSLYLLLNGFMYPLSYQTTALYGGDACHPEKEM